MAEGVEGGEEGRAMCVLRLRSSLALKGGQSRGGIDVALPADESADKNLH